MALLRQCRRKQISCFTIRSDHDSQTDHCQVPVTVPVSMSTLHPQVSSANAVKSRLFKSCKVAVLQCTAGVGRCVNASCLMQQAKWSSQVTGRGLLYGHSAVQA